MVQTILSFKDISLEFPQQGKPPVVALDNINLDVEEGEFSVIVGPSGCGKSSLLFVAAGLTEPSSGSVYLDGAPIDGPGKERGVVFQTYTLFPWQTVQQNVEFGLRLHSKSEKEITETALHFINEVGLSEFSHAYPKQLSGGMRQRVAIARALANDPEIILMDEPFGALDSQTRSILQELLLRIWEKSKRTVLFITHDIDEALFLGDKVHMMSARPGRIKETIDVSIERPRNYEVITDKKFVELKRHILDLLHQEVKSDT